MRRSVLITLLLLLISAVIAWWIHPYIIVEDEDKRHPPKASVTANPFSALESLLISQGIDAMSDNNRDLLKQDFQNTEALFLRNVRQPLSDETIKHILAWVESGGLLVYEPYFYEDQQVAKYLNEEFQVFLRENTEEEHEWFIHAEALLDGQTAYIHMDGDYILNSERNDINPIITSEYGVHGYQLFHGQGEVILLSDSRFLETPQIWQGFSSLIKGDTFYTDHHTLSGHDHAYMGYSLFQGRSKVWFVHDTKTTGLLEKIQQHFPLSSSLFIGWLTLFFFYLQRRLGSQRHSEAGRQQDISLHIHQTGQFFWQQDKGHYLLDQYRQRVIRKLNTRHPQLAGLEQQDLLEQLAKLSQQEFSHIQLALQATSFTKQDFTIAVNTLRKLWTL